MRVNIDKILEQFEGWNLQVTIAGKELDVQRPGSETIAGLYEVFDDNENLDNAAIDQLRELVNPLIGGAAAKWPAEFITSIASTILVAYRQQFAGMGEVCKAVRQVMDKKSASRTEAPKTSHVSHPASNPTEEIHHD